MKARFKKKGLSAIVVLALICTMMISSACSGFFISLGGAGKFGSAESSDDYIITHEANGSDNSELVSNLNTDLVTAVDALGDDDYVNYIIEMDNTSLFTMYQGKTDSNLSYQDYATTRSARITSENMQKKHASVFSKISSKIEASYVASYTSIFNGFAVTIRYGDRDKLTKLANEYGAVSVSISERYNAPAYEAVSNEVDVDETGIFKRPSVEDGEGNLVYDYQGDGMVVAVLDTGLDYTHPAFDVKNLPANGGRMTITDVENVLSELSANKGKGGNPYSGTNRLLASEVYVNQKVPYAYDYADWDTEVNSSEEQAHGTHVSGIIVGRSEEPKYDAQGNVVNKGEPGYDEANYKWDEKLKRSITGIEGVAPLAQILAMKVFSDYQAKTDDTSVFSALEDCLRLKPDVINMSLGLASGFSDQNDDMLVQRAYSAINGAGISLVVAAGNAFSAGRGGHWGVNLGSNPDSGTVASPASYYQSFAVASINGINSKYLLATNGKNGSEAGVAYITESNRMNGERFDFIKDLIEAIKGKNKYSIDYTKAPYNYYNESTGDIDIPFVIIGGTGESADYAGLDVTDKIALIPRGKTTFSQKLRLAYDKGALAAVIYNNIGAAISMQIEDDVTIPSCAITMDAFKAIRDNIINTRNAYLHINETQGAGPFMSDFSSWGPSYSLEIKPEITGHGGEIYSAYPGGHYDRISGTSMAAPNIAGLVILARQHVIANAEYYGVVGSNGNINYNLVESRIYQLMMSTATVPKNEEGDPYSPRRIGAGLADITAMLSTDAYIYVKDTEKDANGEWNAVETKTAKNIWDAKSDSFIKNRTKLDLLDDAERAGVYTMEFYVRNLSQTEDLSYNMTSVVMTEELASDNLTVAERAHMFTNCEKVWIVGEGDDAAVSPNGIVTVPKNEDVRVELTITLSATEKAYLEQVKNKIIGYEKDAAGKEILVDGKPVPIYKEWKPFENGMYIEGFIRLTPTTECAGKTGAKELGVPYLAFYGDWNDAPMVDASIYDTDKDDKDKSLNDEDKRYAQGREFQVFGKFTENEVDYIMPLAKYTFLEAKFADESKPYENQIPYATEDRTTISLGKSSIKELYYVSGFLRGAKTLSYEIRNKHTGQLMYSQTTRNNRRDVSYGNIGGIRVELSPEQFQGQNGATYTFTFTGSLDFIPSEGTTSETYSFDFSIDTDAPIITDAQLRVEKGVLGDYKHYLDFYMHDDNYLQAMSFNLYNSSTKKFKSIWKEGMRPLNSAKNATTRVSYDITGYWDHLKDNEYKISTTIYDYALNTSYYELDLSKVLYTGAVSLDFADIGQYKTYSKSGSSDLTVLVGAYDKITYDANGEYKSMSNINIVPNQTIKLDDSVVMTPNNVWREDLVWKSSNSGIVKINDKTGEIIGRSAGTAYITVSSSRNPSINATLAVTVLSDSVISGYKVPTMNEKALSDIEFESYSKNLRAGEEYEVEVNPIPWYKDRSNLEVVWSSSSPSYATVAVDPNDPFKAVVKAAQGTYAGEILPGSDPQNPVYATEYISNFASSALISATINIVGSKISYTTEIRVSVYKEFVVEAGTLKEYNGTRKNVVIPDNLNIDIIGDACFDSNNDIVSVVIPEGVTKIGRNAFAYCTKLEKVTLPSTIKLIDEWAFAAKSTLKDGLETSLHDVDTSAFKEPVQVSSRAFVNQMALGTTAVYVKNKAVDPNFELLDLGSEDFNLYTKNMRVIGPSAFAYCRYLTDIDLSGCRAMGEMAFMSAGEYAAADFGKYLNIKFYEGDEGGETVLAMGAFAYSGVQSLTIPMTRIAEQAFACTKYLTDVTFTAQNVVLEDLAFYTDTTAPSVLESIEFKHNVEYIGSAAFYLCDSLTTLKFGGSVKYIGESAFAYAESLTSFTIPSGLTYIGPDAFYDSAIEEVIISKDFKENIDILNAFRNSQIATMSVESGGTTPYEVDSETGILIKDVGAGNYEIVMTPFNLDVTATDGEFKVPDKVTVIGTSAFASNTTIKKLDLSLSNVSKVGAYAFSGMTALEEVVLSGKMTTIPDYAFYGCSSLKKVTNTEKITSIGDYAFAGYIFNVNAPSGEALSRITFVALEEIEFADTLKSIGAYAFAQTNLKEFTIPLGVSVIQEGTFQYCTKLTTVYFHSGVTVIGDYAFRDTAISSLNTASTEGIIYIGTEAFANGIGQRLLETDNIKDAYRTVSKLQYVTFTSAIFIGERAFAGYTDGAIKSLTLSSSDEIVHLGDYVSYYQGYYLQGVHILEGAFRLQTSLTSINESANLASIGDYAFAYTGLTSARFIKNSKHIGYGAFMDCENLSGTLTISSDITYVGPMAFANTNITAFATEGSGNNYEAVNGVLFRNFENGRELSHFPTGSNSSNKYGSLINKYVVPEGTTRIGQGAFSTVTTLNSVTLPSTLTHIGDKAFFGSTISVYTFTSFQAPELESGSDFVSIEGNQFDYYWALYANFYYYFSPTSNLYQTPISSNSRINSDVFADTFRYNTITSKFYTDTWVYGKYYDTTNYVEYAVSGASSGGNASVTGGGDYSKINRYGLEIVRPGNGVGYTNFLYNYYFDHTTIGLDVMEAATQSVINLIAALPASSAVTLVHRETIEDVRSAYNRLKITQQALVTNLSRLTAAEDKIATLNATATMVSVSFTVKGEPYKVFEVIKGETVTVPNDPTRSGGTFVGWYYNGEEFDFTKPVDKSMTVVSRWSDDTFTVTFEGISVDYDAQNVLIGGVATDPGTPARSGYTFNGWYYKGVEFDFSTAVNEDITLVADWVKDSKSCGTISVAQGPFNGSMLAVLLSMLALVSLSVVMVVKKRGVKNH